MKIANHNEIIRLFPGVQDHTVVEILALKPTLTELEAAVCLLGNQDEDLIESRHEHSVKISTLLTLLSKENLVPEDDL